MNQISIYQYRQMLAVQRLSGTPKHRSYNLAEHCYFTAVLFAKFAEAEGIEYDLKVFQAVLNHDVLEIMTGDLLYTAKNLNSVTRVAWESIEAEIVKDNPEFDCVTDSQIASIMNGVQLDLFKVCDLLELFIFCKEERLLGNLNQRMKQVEENCDWILRQCHFKSVVDFIIY